VLPAPTLRVRLEQSTPLRDDVPGNLREIHQVLEESRDVMDLVVFPELCLSEYRGGRRLRESALPLHPGAPPPFPLPAGTGLPDLLLGMAEASPEGLLYNSALLVSGGRVSAVHRKIHLPTYGMFQEGRFFAPGLRPPLAFPLPGGWRGGSLICEELWHPALSYLLGVAGVELLLVLAAAPGREPPRREDADALFGSVERWELLVRATALLHGIFVVLVNRAGWEEGVTFAGGSMVAAPDGEILARGAQGEPDRLHVKLERSALRRARRPFSHLRDEDPELLLRGLVAMGYGGGRPGGPTVE